MRDIYRTVKMDIDGKEMTFRVAKLDAFSGAQLLQLVRRYLPKAEGGQKVGDLVEPIFMALKGEELKGLMVSCLNHTEIQLEAGWHPVMRGENWGWPELEHDTGEGQRGSDCDGGKHGRDSGKREGDAAVGGRDQDGDKWVRAM